MSPDDGRDLRAKLGCGVNVFVEPGRAPLKVKRSQEKPRMHRPVFGHLMLHNRDDRTSENGVNGRLTSHSGDARMDYYNQKKIRMMAAFTV